MKLSLLYEGKKKTLNDPYVRDPRGPSGEDAEREGQSSKTVRRQPGQSSRGPYLGPMNP